MKAIPASIQYMTYGYIRKGRGMPWMKGLLLFVIFFNGFLFKGISQTCSITTPATACTGGNFLFTATTNLSSPTFTWKLINNNTGAGIMGTPTANQASINHGNMPGTYTIEVTVLNGSGGTETCSQTITVSSDVKITTQPSSITSGIGCSVSFNVTATGTGPLSYQWRKGGTDISGATNDTYNFGSIASGDAGSYDVKVTNAWGSVTSNAAVLTVNPPLNAGSHNTVTITSCVGVNPVDITFIGYTPPSGGVLPYTYQWKLNGVDIPGATNDSYDPGAFLSPGTYNINVQITDACGTIVSTPVKSFIVVPDPTMTVSGASSVCLNGSTMLNAVISGGAGTMTPQWQSGASALGPWTDIPGATGLTYQPPTGTSGTYYYRAYLNPNVAPCNNASAIHTLIVNNILAATVTTSNVLCFGTNMGSITIANPSGGGGNFEYSINGGTNWQSSGNFTGLAPGTYNVQMRDAALTSCVMTLNNALTITQPTALTATSSFTSVLCNGGNTGTMTAVGAGGTSPYSYVIAGPTVNTTGATTGIFTGLSAGAYTITVTDNNGCTITTSQTITQPTALTATSSFSPVLCNGGNTGTMTAVGADGTSPYNYTIAGPTVNTTGATTGIFTGLTAGSYTITVTDNNGCTITTSQTISQPTALSASSSFTPVICFGGNTGMMTAAGNGGTSPYSYVIAGPVVNTTGAATGIFSGLTAGSYTITVTDNNGCTITTSQTITQPTALTATSSFSPVLCNGGNTGTMTAGGNNGTSPYSYVIAGPTVNTTGATTGIFSGLSAGAYTITATDKNGCSITTSQTITQPTALTATSFFTPVLCNGGNTGTMTAAGNGGTSPYSYVIAGPTVNTTGATSGLFTALTTGSYSITVTDARGCTVTTTQTVAQPATPVTISNVGSGSPPVCSGTTLNLSSSATGGTGTITYSWTGPNSFTSNQQNPNIANVTTAASGIYSVTAMDANGCSATTNTTVNITPSVTPSVIISPNPIGAICSGTSVTFTATPTNGGSNPVFQWQINGTNAGTNTNSFTSSTFSNADRVTVIMTSNAVCPSPATVTSNQVTMTVNPTVIPTVSISESANNICPGAPVTFTAIGTNTGANPVYQWKVNGVNAGTNSSSFTSTTWTNGDDVTVEMTSNALCASPALVTSNSINVNVIPAPVPSVTIAASTNDICPGTSVTFTSTPTNGGTNPSYQWQVNGANVGTNSPAFSSNSLTNGQIVTVVMTSNAPCANPVAATSAGITMNVLPAPVPTVAVAVSATTICPGTSATFTATPTNGGTTPLYQWKVNGNNVGSNSNIFTTSSLVNGDIVTVVMTSNAACAVPTTATSSPITMTVSPAAPSTPGIISGAAEQCVNKNNLTYSISPVANATTYTWTVPAGWTINSGQGSVSISVSTSAAASGGNITVTAGNSCGTSAAQGFAVTVSLGVPGQPGIISGPTAICPNRQLSYFFNAVPGAKTYTWTVPAGWTILVGQGTTAIEAQSPASPADGTISVVATSVCGNSAVQTLNVTGGINATLNAGPDQTVCIGTTSVILNGEVGGTIKNHTEWDWVLPGGSVGDNGQKLNTIYTLPAGMTPGSITVKLVSNETTVACPSVEDEMIITMVPNLTASIGGTTTICSGTSTNITFTATPNTTITYKIGSGTNQTIGVGASGTVILSTGNLTASTTFNLVSVAYTNVPACTQPATGSATITVLSLPTVIAGTTVVVCQSPTPTAITLTGAGFGGSATSAAWSITSGGGTLSSTAQTNAPSTITYTPAANYTDTVTLTLTTDAAGPCPPISATRTITINPLPTVNAGGPNEVCQSGTPSAITLTGATVGGGATTGAWAITSGGGSLSSTSQTNSPATVTYTPAANFTGTVTLTLTTDAPASCTPVTATRTITVNPISVVNAGPAQTICSNATATMAASLSGGATSGTWSTSGSGTFSNNNPNAVYTPSNADVNAGSVTLTYTADDPAGPCSAVTATTVLTIQKVVVITNQPVNTGVCAGLPADLTVSSVGDGLTYQWYKGVAPGGTMVNNSSNITGAQTSTLHFNQAAISDDGSYYVIVSGTAPCSPVTSEVRTLNVDQAIVITTQPAAQTLCEGVNASFTVVADANGDPLVYQWRKNGVDITGQTSATLTLNNISPADAGNYDVVITGPAGYTCSSTISTPASLIVNKNSTINLSSAAGSDAQTSCISTAIAPITYVIGGGGTGAAITTGALPAGLTGSFSGGVFTISGTPTASGNFSYTVTTSGPCNNSSASGTMIINANSTLSLSSGAGSNNPTSCEDVALTPITYAVGGGATGATITGLPVGVTGVYSNSVFTISGTPTTPGTYPYSVVSTGPCVQQTLTGTITIGTTSTLALTSGNANQTLCINSVPANIVYTIGGGATGITVAGLPPGMVGNYNNGVLTIANTPTAAGTYNYTVTTTGNCANPVLTGIITVDPAPAGGTLSPAVNTVCGATNSGTITLTGHSGTILRWESSTNGGGVWSPINNTSTSLSYSNLGQTTLYRVIVQSGVCPLAYSTNAVVSVVLPITPTATVSPVSICVGESSNLGAKSGLPPTWSDFDATFNRANPAGWRITQNGTEIIFPANADNASTFPWSETNGPKTPFNGGVTYNNLQTDGKFAIASGQVVTTMETPVFSTIGMTSAVLQFYQALVFAAGATGKIEISTDGGATYNQTLTQYAGPLNIGNPLNSWAQLNIDLSSFIGLSNLRVRFSYNGVLNSNWAIDGLGLQPPGPTVNYNWTLINPPGVPSPYYLNTTTGQNVVSTPPTPGTYTYQVATMIGSCPGGTANVIVEVKPLPVCNITGPVTVCPVATNTYTGPTGAGYSYQWTVTGAATISGSATSQAVNVVANNVCGTYTVSLVTRLNNCPSAPCTLVVNIVDTQAPLITLASPGSLGCNPTAAQIAVAFGAATVSDNCVIALTPTYTDGVEVAGAGCQFSITRTWTVKDACNNTGTAQQTLTFTRDITVPVISISPAGTLGCNATTAQVAAAFGTATVTDNCSTNLSATGTVTAEVVSGCQVSVTKNWTVTDACGNIGTASQTVTFTRDNTPPVLTCPTVPPACVVPGNSYTIPLLTASDNCSANSALTISYSITGATTRNGTGPDASGVFNAGVSIITWTVVDECGNSNTCTTEVTISPKPSPIIYHN